MRLRHLAPLLLLLAAAPAPRRARPALWRLYDADTTIYLFGTVHALPRGTKWRDPKIEAALARSSTLTLETVLDDAKSDLSALLFAMGRAEKLPPVSARVPADKQARLAQLIKASGFEAAQLDDLKSWVVAIALTGAAMNEAGVAADEGVERSLTATFRARGAPVDGLETARQQLGFFDVLPEASQRAFLVATLDDPAATRQEFAQMVAAWSKGDVAAIARAFAEDPEFTPELRETLVRRRNAAWAAELKRRLARPGTSFVAVGAGHLAGRDSLIAMLQKQGLKVRRAD